MLPKINHRKKSIDFYPKLTPLYAQEENIAKLKYIQEFLEEDSYH